MDGIKIMQDLHVERERGRAREAETPVPGTWEIPAPKGAVWLLQGEAAAAVPGVGGGVLWEGLCTSGWDTSNKKVHGKRSFTLPSLPASMTP